MIEKINQLSIGMALGIGILLGGLLYMNSGDSIVMKDRQIQTMMQEVNKTKKEVKSAQDIVKNKTKYQDELNYVSDRLRAALEYLPTDLMAQDILRQMYEEARNSGVKLISVKPGQTEKLEFYEQISLDVELEGGYSQLTLFLSYISKVKRIIRIKSFELSTKEISDGIPILNLKGKLVAYRYVPPEKGANPGGVGGQ